MPANHKKKEEVRSRRDDVAWPTSIVSEHVRSQKVKHQRNVLFFPSLFKVLRQCADVLPVQFRVVLVLFPFQVVCHFKAFLAKFPGKQHFEGKGKKRHFHQDAKKDDSVVKTKRKAVSILKRDDER